MSPKSGRFALVGIVCAALAAASACSPGTLPGSPTPFTPGGGGRYSGTMTIGRAAGPPFNSGARPLDLSLVVGSGDQLSGQFTAGDAVGSVTATLNGSMSAGSFSGAILVSLPVTLGGAVVTCEGIQTVSGTLSGRDVSFATPPSSVMSFDNCSGLLTTVSAAGTATSPVPGSLGNRARLVASVVPGTNIPESTCDGAPGYAFTVTLSELSGVAITFDDTYRVERLNQPPTDVAMPLSSIEAGARRSIDVCSSSTGFYQAVFTGQDANGNGVVAASPVVTMGVPGQLTNWGPFTTAASGGALQLQLCMRDYNANDGDILRVTVNGALVVERELVPDQFCLLTPFNPGMNTIAVTAINDGVAPPNTGELTISSVDASGNAVPSTSRIQQYALNAGESSSSSIIVNAR
jgi:hypothetical protein